MDITDHDFGPGTQTSEVKPETASLDKLAEIKQRYRDDPNMYWVSEVDWLLGEVERLRAALDTEHEIQRVLLERLGIEWTPGEPFVALVEAEIVRLLDERDRWQWIAGCLENAKKQRDRERNRDVQPDEIAEPPQ